MSDVVTFNDSKNKFTLTVKKEFLEKCPNPSQFDTFELNSKHYMFKFLSNPNGPAIIRHSDNRKEYWLDGVCLNVENPELAAKIEHNANFNKRVQNLD